MGPRVSPVPSRDRGALLRAARVPEYLYRVLRRYRYPVPVFILGRRRWVRRLALLICRFRKGCENTRRKETRLLETFRKKSTVQSYPGTGTRYLYRFRCPYPGTGNDFVIYGAVRVHEPVTPNTRIHDGTLTGDCRLISGLGCFASGSDCS